MNLKTVWRISPTPEVTYRFTHAIDVDTRKVLCDRNSKDASWHTMEGHEQDPPTCPGCLAKDPRHKERL